MNSKVPAPKPAASVEAFLASLEHPFKREILALRQIMLGIDPAITEEIKWNAPSFRTTEHFATMQLRAKDGVQLILHFGARKRDTTGIAIADPHGLLDWLGPDRASIKFVDIQMLDARRLPLEQIVRHWIGHVI